MTSSPSWITLSPSHPSEGIIGRRAVRPPGARPGRPGITPGEYSNGASGENHSGSHMPLDQAGWHLSDKLDIPANITLMPLPPKSPELNPVENIWQYMRDNWLSNRV